VIRRRDAHQKIAIRARGGPGGFALERVVIDAEFGREAAMQRHLVIEGAAGRAREKTHQRERVAARGRHRVGARVIGQIEIVLPEPVFEALGREGAGGDAERKRVFVLLLPDRPG
jgi:hypothetical protein